MNHVLSSESLGALEEDARETEEVTFNACSNSSCANHIALLKRQISKQHKKLTSSTVENKRLMDVVVELETKCAQQAEELSQVTATKRELENAVFLLQQMQGEHLEAQATQFTGSTRKKKLEVNNGTALTALVRSLNKQVENKEEEVHALGAKLTERETTAAKKDVEHGEEMSRLKRKIEELKHEVQISQAQVRKSVDVSAGLLYERNRFDTERGYWKEEYGRVKKEIDSHVCNVPSPSLNLEIAALKEELEEQKSVNEKMALQFYEYKQKMGSLYLHLRKFHVKKIKKLLNVDVEMSLYKDPASGAVNLMVEAPGKASTIYDVDKIDDIKLDPLNEQRFSFVIEGKEVEVMEASNREEIVESFREFTRAALERQRHGGMKAFTPEQMNELHNMLGGLGDLS